VKQISDKEIYLLIKYTKSVLWRVTKRLSYIEGARCLKVKNVCVSASIALCTYVFMVCTGTALAMQFIQGHCQSTHCTGIYHIIYLFCKKIYLLN